jgi:hypothetical protein
MMEPKNPGLRVLTLDAFEGVEEVEEAAVAPVGVTGLFLRDAIYFIDIF